MYLLKDFSSMVSTQRPVWETIVFRDSSFLLFAFNENFLVSSAKRI